MPGLVAVLGQVCQLTSWFNLHNMPVDTSFLNHDKSWTIYNIEPWQWRQLA